MDIVTLGGLDTQDHTSIEETFLVWVFIVAITTTTITMMTNALNLDRANQKIFLNQDQIFLVQVQKMYLILILTRELHQIQVRRQDLVLRPIQAHPKAHLPGVKLIFLAQAPKIKEHHLPGGQNYRNLIRNNLLNLVF